MSIIIKDAIKKILGTFKMKAISVRAYYLRILHLIVKICLIIEILMKLFFS